MEMETTYVQLRIKDSILIGTYKKDVRITLEVAREIVSTRLSFTRRTTMPTLILSEGVVTIDKAARDYLTSPEGTEGISACAIITRSRYSSFLGNLFLQLTRGALPVKMFKNMGKAEQWLHQYVTT